MRTFLWPAEDGWPYPDAEVEEVDPRSDVDDDILTLTSRTSHVFDSLSRLEREVIDSRFGLHGVPVRSMRQLHDDLGVPRSDLRNAMGSGLAKLRTQLA